MNVLITGATKGIGKAIAQKFAGEGANLALCARTQSDLGMVKNELEHKHGIEVFTQVCDMAKKEQVLSFSDLVKSKWNKLDVLINNAGLFIPGNMIEEEDGAMEDIVKTNLFSAYYLTREVLPLMLPQKSGHIVNMCSVASLKAYSNGGSYTISKHALLGFSRSLREELKEFGIGVTAFLPGAVYTPSWEGAGFPEDRFIPAEDIATMVFEICALSNRTVVEEILIKPMLGDI